MRTSSTWRGLAVEELAGTLGKDGRDAGLVGCEILGAGAAAYLVEHGGAVGVITLPVVCLGHDEVSLGRTIDVPRRVSALPVRSLGLVGNVEYVVRPAEPAACRVGYDHAARTYQMLAVIFAALILE